MRGTSVRYGVRMGCRFGNPHDFKAIKENNSYKVEKCSICGLRKRWNKGFKGRIDNPEYLKAHVRNFAQANGSTKRVYMKMYQPEKTKIILN